MIITKIVKKDGKLWETNHEFKEKLGKNLVLLILDNLENSLQGDNPLYIIWEEYFYTDNRKEFNEYVLSKWAVKI